MSEGLDYWDLFRIECERANAPLYAKIISGISRDGDLKELASHVKSGQPMANIILAAVHFLLLRGIEHPLRGWYPNLNGGRSHEGDPFPRFKDFINAHREEVDALIRKGVTNTNEVARCSFLHAAFRAIAKEAGEPMALIEIGPSAGLNMLWDNYRVHYTSGSESHVVGPDAAPLTLECELRGNGRPPFGPSPKIASRVGLELNPVDLGDPYWSDWLKALVWPDNVARFERLAKAIAFARTQNLDIRAGSALDNLTNAIGEIPENTPVCVYATFVVYQFSTAMRETLENLFVVASLRRPIWFLSVEGTLTTPGEAPVDLRIYRDGAKEKRHLAVAHPHGAWLKWMAP